MNQVMSVLLVAIKVRKIDIFEKLGQKRYIEVHRQVIEEALVLIFGAVILILL